MRDGESKRFYESRNADQKKPDVKRLAFFFALLRIVIKCADAEKRCCKNCQDSECQGKPCRTREYLDGIERSAGILGVSKREQ